MFNQIPAKSNVKSCNLHYLGYNSRIGHLPKYYMIEHFSNVKIF